MDQTPSPASQYIHGTSAGEQKRLSILNAVMNVACLREMNLKGTEQILDVGSGLGQFTRLMGAAVHPAGRVIGIERDERQIRKAHELAETSGESHLLHIRAGDAYQFPLSNAEWGSFDVVHTRFLLEHVRDPQLVVRQMVKAARPGGRIILLDDDHDLLRLYPEPPGASALWHAFIRSFDRLGNDPYVGRKLVSLLHEAGARPVRNRFIFFGACAGEGTFPALSTNLIDILTGARQTILQFNLFNEAYFDEVIGNLRAWRQRPDAALWYPICYAEGEKRE